MRRYFLIETEIEVVLKLSLWIVSNLLREGNFRLLLLRRVLRSSTQIQIWQSLQQYFQLSKSWSLRTKPFRKPNWPLFPTASSKGSGPRVKTSTIKPKGMRNPSSREAIVASQVEGNPLGSFQALPLLLLHNHLKWWACQKTNWDSVWAGFTLSNTFWVRRDPYQTEEALM